MHECRVDHHAVVVGFVAVGGECERCVDECLCLERVQEFVACEEWVDGEAHW